MKIGIIGTGTIAKTLAGTMSKMEEVELIYIATPHSHHYAHMKLCIENGKPVLCEKAFTIFARKAHSFRCGMDSA